MRFMEYGLHEMVHQIYRETFPRNDQIFPSHVAALWDNIRAAAHRKRDKNREVNNILFLELFYLLE
jgi:hypothetical protein